MYLLRRDIDPSERLGLTMNDYEILEEKNLKSRPMCSGTTAF